MITPSNNKKLINFDVNHHKELLNSYKLKMEWWDLQTKTLKERCSLCWLRKQQCYCHIIASKRDIYEKEILSKYKPNVDILMYYNYMEIGRSANTAHYLHAVCPFICSSSIIFGDVEDEIKLLDDMENEFKSESPQTVILFPCKDSILLSEWLKNRPVKTQNTSVKLVMLDGTFPGASRIAKYLMYSCSLRGIPCPVVKLDLENNACKSAVAGMMYQPGKDKICTYQAAVMAMQQASVLTNDNITTTTTSIATDKLIKQLHQDLEDWIAYILHTKIKFGKSQPKRSMMHMMDTSPTELVAEILKVNPPPASTTVLHKHKQQRRLPLHENVIDKESSYNNSITITNNNSSISSYNNSITITNNNSSISSNVILVNTRRFQVFHIQSHSTISI